MIISCSRRTDIPAAYVPWFMNRLAAGYCTVPNPVNPRRVARIPLRPEDVEVIVFWSKNPAPLLPHLETLDRQGYRYFFQFTLNGYDPELEPHVPAIASGIEVFRTLSQHVGCDRVIWRYDPIILGRKTDAAYHIDKFSYIADALAGHTRRAVVSIVDYYRKTDRGLAELERKGYRLERNVPPATLETLIPPLAKAAHRNGIEIQSCAEDIDLRPYGIMPGKCIDDSLIERAFGMRVSGAKDPFQRPLCGCIKSRDIGMYNSCPQGCRYCYATNLESAAPRHHEDSPSLLGWYAPET